MTPPPYPRIPYLWEPEVGATGDRVVSLSERPAWLERPVVVEEKLDGANVSIWWEGGRLRVASRGGPGAMDRGGQLGPLRARVHRLDDALRAVLDGDGVIYAEWLWLTHTVHYDHLDDHLVVLDVWRPGSGFADLSTRDELIRAGGLVGPPLLFAGVLRTARALVDLMGISRLGSAPMEGVVLRGDDRSICKVLRPGFVRAGDDRIGRRRNAVDGRAPRGV